MQHQIPAQRIGNLGQPMADAVQACVHCGFCLPACPTYEVFGEEMDSPRGRIFIMKEALEGNVPLDESVPYLDRCLGCVGCETACPSGVAYGDLITSFRAYSNEKRQRTIFDRLFRWSMLTTLPYPNRFRLAVRLGMLMRRLRVVFPGRMATIFDLLPKRILKSMPLPATYPAEGTRRARVALLAGCAQQVLDPDINWATLRVLAMNGVEVVIPGKQVCCGALAAHTGALKQAQRFARQNLSAFPKDVDAIVTNAAGCGSGMHEYGLWMRGEPDEAAAKALSGLVQDVSVFLCHLGMTRKSAFREPRRIAYHDACHLAHAQGIRDEPRELLRSVDNLELVEIPNGEICCGSAGTYNMEQPDAAALLGAQKAKSIINLNVDSVATGNIGCMAQIASHLRLQQRQLPVEHVMQVLDRATPAET